jgi:hypothetical protein
VRNEVGDDCSMVAGCSSSQDMYLAGVASIEMRAVAAAAFVMALD